MFVILINLLLILLMLKKILDGNFLVGDIKSFSLEERIFNTVCIVSFVAMCIEFPFNLYIGLWVPAYLCLFGIFFSIFVYYISRFKRKSALGINIFCIVCHLSFGINYFFNSGIAGPNLLLYSLVFLMTITILPLRRIKMWIPINITFVIILLVIEYLYPNIAPYAYNGSMDRVIDFGATYFVVVLLYFYTIRYLRKNYDYEHHLVIEKSNDIQDKNDWILAQKAEVEHLNTEKNKLFSIVTHDLRAPLNSIQSYLELLADADLNEEEQIVLKKHLLQITRDTSAMLTNVLSWSKTQMDGANVNLVTVDVKQTLSTGLNIEKDIAARKGVTLTIHSEDDLHVIADQNMFQLVVRNLVSNAIKFTPVDGAVEVIAETKGGECLIAIKDNGLGIETEKRANLFKLKASSTYGTNNEKGIGLGLLMCKEFTDLQGGKIWFEPNEGKGSIFNVSFKLKAS